MVDADDDDRGGDGVGSYDVEQIGGEGEVDGGGDGDEDDGSRDDDMETATTASALAMKMASEAAWSRAAPR